MSFCIRQAVFSGGFFGFFQEQRDKNNQRTKVLISDDEHGGTCGGI